MSLTSLASLMNLAGLTKGKGTPLPPGTVIARTAALLLASAAPTVVGSGVIAGATITGVAGALTMASSAPTLSTGGVDTYAVGSSSPGVVADFSNTTEYFRVGGTATDFETMFDLGTTTAYPTSLRTMFDSDGLLKWGPHNLALNSASPATQSITVTSGADYTVAITGTGSVTLSNAGTGTVTAGSPVEITASTTTLTLTVSGSPSTMWCYRSDLGGMVNNPDTGTTYVPTAGTVRYLHRRGNHVYNGTAWVKEGIQVEPEARTNLLLHSNQFDTTWTNSETTETANSGTSPDGTNNAWKLADTATTNFHFLRQDITTTASTVYAFSVWVKAQEITTFELNFLDTTLSNGAVAEFNLSTGSIISSIAGGTGTLSGAGIEDYGGGFYRIWLAGSHPGTSSSVVLLLGTNSYSATGGEGALIYGAQLEAGHTPSSYIPTGSATVTRAAETLTIPAANMSASTSAMSLQLDGTITYADEGAEAQQTFLRWQTDANNYISLDLDTDSTATGEVNANQAVSATVDTVVAGAEYTAGVNVAFNIASRHTSGAINVAKDGTAATADTTPTSLVDLSARNCELFQDAMGNIGLFRQWDADLGDTGIATASLPRDDYAVSQYAPLNVADFVNEYYRVGGNVSDFPTMFSGYTTRSDLATMVDSDGYIKWCPHNRLTYSEDFTNAAWVNSSTTDTANSDTAPDGTTTADTITASGANGSILQTWTAVAGDWTFAVWLKRKTGTGTIEIAADSGTWTSKTIDGTWQLFTVEQTVAAGSKTAGIRIVTSGDEVYAWGAHLYRSDLGGMVNVPTDIRSYSSAATYVQTTTAAKYLQRRGNHVYNGSIWVNKGIQMETEARTNLIVQSNDLSTWTNFDATSTNSQATGSDGNTSLASLTETNATTVNQSNYTTATVVSGSNYCYSAEFYAGNRSFATISVSTATSTNWFAATFNLSTGAVSGSSSGAGGGGVYVNSGVINLGGGRYRCWVVGNINSTTAYVYMGGADSGTPTYNVAWGAAEYTGANNVSVYLGFAQAEAGETPSSYIPTSGATVTRAADALTIPAANLPAVSTAMTTHYKGTLTFADAGTFVLQFDFGASVPLNRSAISVSGAYTGALRLDTFVTGSPGQFGEGVPGTFSAGVNTPFNFAVRNTDAGGGAANYAISGTASTESTGSAFGCPTVVTDFTATILNGNLEQMRFWNEDLGDTGIATAST